MWIVYKKDACEALYSSERARIHEKRGPPGGALFQQLGVFFTFRGPQNYLFIIYWCQYGRRGHSYTIPS